jgi:hypothetical protein
MENTGPYSVQIGKDEELVRVLLNDEFFLELTGPGVKTLGAGVILWLFNSYAAFLERKRKKEEATWAAEERLDRINIEPEMVEGD